MQPTGTLVVRTYLTRAQIPVRGATVIVASRMPDGRHQVISIQQTDESGMTAPVQLPAPEVGLGLKPDQPLPYSTYTLIVEHPNYELAVYEGLQVFPGVETIQTVPMIPLSIDLSTEEEGSNVTTVTPQPL